jgi:ketosteroid isomerase-like protein
MGCSAGLSQLPFAELVDKHIDRIRRSYAAWNRRDIDAALEPIAPDVVWEVRAPGSDVVLAYRGHEGVRVFWRDFWEAWEEISIEAERFVEEGDSVLCAIQFRGRGRESGIEVEAPSFHVQTFRHGKVVRFQAFWDEREATAALDDLHERLDL